MRPQGVVEEAEHLGTQLGVSNHRPGLHVDAGGEPFLDTYKETAMKMPCDPQGILIPAVTEPSRRLFSSSLGVHPILRPQHGDQSRPELPPFLFFPSPMASRASTWAAEKRRLYLTVLDGRQPYVQ